MRSHILGVLEGVFQEQKNLFLIDLDVSPSGDIRVTLDSDTGLSLKDCVGVSRKIARCLTSLEFDFSLEVTSAGATEPLKNIRQYKKNLGRLLDVKTALTHSTGTLTKIGEMSLTLAQEKRVPKPVGKGKVTVREHLEIPFSEIVEAKIVVKF